MVSNLGRTEVDLHQPSWSRTAAHRQYDRPAHYPHRPRKPILGLYANSSALVNLGHHVGRGTIANTLREHGIDPAPERGKRTAWSTFLKAHWECIAATDFFTVEVVTLRGLVTHYILFFLDLTSRTVKIAGITPHPREEWMLQRVRNLTDPDEPFPRRTRFLIMDRDTKYSATFRAALTRWRIEPIRLPPRSPNLKASASYCLLC